MRLLLKNLLFTLVVPGTVAGAVPYLLSDGARLAPGPLRAIGLVLFALGFAIYAWCVWDFASFGGGTPAPIDAPRKLVVRGLYRYTRNPMYVGVLTIVVAWAVALRAVEIALYAAAVASLFHLFIRLYEEPHLEREFGDEYVRYKQRVGRWLPRPLRP